MLFPLASSFAMVGSIQLMVSMWMAPMESIKPQMMVIMVLYLRTLFSPF